MVNKINDIDVNELLDYLENAIKNKEEQSVEKKEDSVTDFIKSHGITSGLDRVPNYIIYYHYHKSTEKPLALRTFFIEFSKVFTSGRVGTHRFYFLDNRSFDLTREGVLNAKKFKEENIKRKRKVSTLAEKPYYET